MFWKPDMIKCLRKTRQHSETLTLTSNDSHLLTAVGKKTVRKQERCHSDGFSQLETIYPLIMIIVLE